jgi:hypothetical protein
LFDAYVLKARVAPAVIAVIPALLLAGGSAFRLDATSGVIGLVAGAIGVVVCAVVRDRGLSLQPLLWSIWGGPPTTRRLRFREGDPRLVSRLHLQVETATGHSLPDRTEEEVDPEAADERYAQAVAILRERTRGDGFAPLASENAEYGFRRNCLGIKPFALLIAGAMGITSLVLALAVGSVRFWLDSAFAFGLMIAWSTVVSPAWVRSAAELYADRLFEAASGLSARP